jgi:peroxiredoxin
VSDPESFEWKTLTTDDYFRGKRVVVFALPGAFTPTCSASHLPGYEESYHDILQLGVDEVYCLSVNDAFVMRQWGIHQGMIEDRTPGSLGFTKVKLIPDGAAHFTRGMGMSTLWTSERGFGERSWRYSMVVDDGVIEHMFVEQPMLQNSGPDPYEVSDAATMLEYLRTASRSSVDDKDKL